MGNTVLLKKNHSFAIDAGYKLLCFRGAIIVSVCSLRSSSVTVIVFEIVIFCCIVVGNCFSILEAQLRYACSRFSADLTVFSRKGVDFDYLDFVSSVNLFAVSAFHFNQYFTS